MSDMEMWRAVNSLNKENFGFEAKSVSWSGRGLGPSIMIRFASTDTHHIIDAHSQNIRQRLAHGIPIHLISLTKNIRCSKLVIANVPCQHPDNMDQVVPIADVISELKKDEQYRGLSIVQGPRWTAADLSEKLFGSVSFVFEDPDGSTADKMLSNVIYVLGHRCSFRIWKDKIELPQCLSCWGYGMTHASCQSRRRLCGATSHTENDHPRFCRECVQANISTPSGCTHHSCVGCKQNHPANDMACPSCRVTIERIRKQNALRVNAQFDPNPHNMAALRGATGNRFIN